MAINISEAVRSLDQNDSFSDVRLVDTNMADQDEIEAHVKAAASRLATAGGRAFGSGNYQVSQICTFTADRSGIIYGAVLTRIE